jgi:hypothetical protein
MRSFVLATFLKCGEVTHEIGPMTPGKMKTSKEAGGVVQELLDNLPGKTRKIEALIWKHWPRIIGKENSHYAAPLRVTRKTLQIVVADAVWMNELSLLSEQIIANIEETTGKKIVEKIRLIHGDLPWRRGERRELKTRFQHREPSIEERREVVETCAIIQDEKLRSLMERIVLARLGSAKEEL